MQDRVKEAEEIMK